MENLVFAATNALVWLDWVESHPSSYELKFPHTISK